jgi:formylglycine-generating enzyme required for sulfatase activity
MLKVTRRRALLTCAALLLLFALMTLVWAALDWPPLRLVLAYGLPPAGGPTGRITEAHGMQFVELGPGYFHASDTSDLTAPSFTERLLRIFSSRTDAPHPDKRSDRLARWIEVDSPIYIARTELTHAQYESATTLSRRHWKWETGAHPIRAFSETEAREVLLDMSQQGSLRFRFPTQAEWEYACRAGAVTKYPFGDNPQQLHEYAWLEDNSGFDRSEADPARSLERRPRIAAQKKPNAWSLYDMLGNVEEWGSSNSPVSSELILCGGSCNPSAQDCQPASRNRRPLAQPTVLSGIRLVLSTGTE